jgi:hypothetical protein
VAGRGHAPAGGNDEGARAGAFSRNLSEAASADTAGADAVGAIGGDAIGTDAIRTVGGDAIATDAIRTVGGDTVDTDTIRTIGGDTIGTDAIRAIGSDTIGTDAIRTVGSDTIGTDAIRTIGGDAVDAYTVGAAFGHQRRSAGLNGRLRRGEGTGGQGGDNEAGEDVLFHGQAPGRAGRWLRNPCYSYKIDKKAQINNLNNRISRYKAETKPRAKVSVR